MQQDATAEPMSLRFMHKFTPEVRRRAEKYIARFNATHAPGNLTLTALVNFAVDEYLERVDSTDEAA